MLDLVSLGELLIDFTPVGISEHNNPIFERNPGGDQPICSVRLPSWGLRLVLSGRWAMMRLAMPSGEHCRKIRLTQRIFSYRSSTRPRWPLSIWMKRGIDRLASIEKMERIPCSDSTMWIWRCWSGRCCFFFSSVLLSEGDSRETSYRLAEYAREQGALTVFDPNLRENLWENLDDAKACIQKALHLADIVKVSEEELYFLTDHAGLLDGGRMLLERYGLKALLITMGAAGCCAVLPEYSLTVPGFDVKAVDTTAAGDSFTGGFLYKLLAGGYDIDRIEKRELLPILRFANAVGALTTTKKGLPSMRCRMERKC